jgi:hypothetical protein
MSTITVSKKMGAENDVVVIPRKEYEAFSQWKQSVRVRVDEHWFWTPEWQKKEAEADRAIRRGKVSPAYTNHRLLLSALKRRRT